MNDTLPYIATENLVKVYGEREVVRGANINVKAGEVVGLLGPNGAGKTTLFRLLLDLLKPDDGSVWIDSVNPMESEAWKLRVGAYIDEGFLIDFLTPEEYFAFLGKISGKTQAEVDERLKDFERFAADEIFGQKKLIRNLSAGNKQKVGIISALFNKPNTIILDEPFNFLDPSSQNMLKHLLTEYNRETGATILCSSHNLAHTVDISSRIALLEHGVIVRDIDNAEGAAAQELDNYFESDK